VRVFPSLQLASDYEHEHEHEHEHVKSPTSHMATSIGHLSGVVYVVYDRVQV